MVMGSNVRQFSYITTTLLREYLYLGIEFSSSGSWCSAIANISIRGMKTLLLFLLKDYICSGIIY